MKCLHDYLFDLEYQSNTLVSSINNYTQDLAISEMDLLKPFLIKALLLQNTVNLALKTYDEN